MHYLASSLFRVISEEVQIYKEFHSLAQKKQKIYIYSQGHIVMIQEKKHRISVES
jgi:hypothetical protein